ncbi:MAG TPA: 4-phosphoerythronate dehydrogenase [Candidatus Binatia bacterium]
MRPRLVVDENIPLAREAFGELGEVELLPGRRIDAAAVAQADALIVRSVTRVDERLLGASPVRFVATATIGTDHVDLGYLERRGIAFAHAPGCNARSVAEYVTAALLELETEGGRPASGWHGATLGVVGAGNVGTRVMAMASALGLRVLVCDPPRAEVEGESGFVPLARLLEEADVVTLHVPLTRDGRHPTWHLLGAAELARLRPGALLINTSRGGVADDRALREACAAGRISAVLDVWEGEPEPDAALLDLVRLASPHIAGYSLDGKLAGTRMVAEAAYRFFGVAPPDPRRFEVPNPEPLIRLEGAGRAAVREAVRRAYAIRDDDARMRAALAAAPSRGAEFDRLRRDYPVRREFPTFVVDGPDLAADDRTTLAALGFRLGTR